MDYKIIHTVKKNWNTINTFDSNMDALERCKELNILNKISIQQWEHQNIWIYYSYWMEIVTDLEYNKL